MRSRGPLVLMGTAMLAVAVLIATMAADKRNLAFTLGVRPGQVAAVVRSGSEACQRPIDVSADAESVEFQVGTYRRAGEPLEVTVRNPSGVIGSARVPGGYSDNSVQRVPVAGIEQGSQIAVCIQNIGHARLALYGGPFQAARTSAVFLDGKRQPADLALVFRREHSQSMLLLLPTVFQRASLFHATWVGTWLLWAMAALLVIVVPLFLVFAFVAAFEETKD